MPEAIELATAYVSLTVSARGMQRQLDQEVGTAAKAAGLSARRSIEGELSAVNPRIDFAAAVSSSGAAAAGRTAGADLAGGVSEGLASIDTGSALSEGLVSGLDVAERAATGRADRLVRSVNSKLDEIGSDRLIDLGARGLAGAGVAAAGLFTLAQAAGDYSESVSKATQLVGVEGARALEEFADQAIDTAGISRQAALDASANFSAIGKFAGLTGDDLLDFGTDLTQLAGDLASFGNTSVDEAIAAIGAGLRGESEPLRRFNIFLDDATLKQRYFAISGEEVTGTLTNQQKVLAAQAEILAQTTDAQGDYLRTSDSFANQTKALGEELKNLAIDIGGGIVPLAGDIVGGAREAVDWLEDLSPAAKEGLGTVATYATLAAGAVSAVAVGAGALGKVRDQLTVVTEGVGGTTRSLNNAGKAAAALGGGLAALASIEIAASVGNEITDATQRVEDDVARVVAAAESGSGGVAAAFGELADSETSVFRLSDAWEDFGRTFTLSADGTKQNIESVDRAFQQILDSSPAAAARVVEDLQRQADAAKDGSQAQKDYQELVDRYAPKVETAGAAALVAEDAQRRWNAALAEGVDPTSDQGQAIGQMSDAFDSVADKLADVGREVDLLRLDLDAGSTAAESYAGAIDLLSPDAAKVSAAFDLAEANRDFAEVIKGLPKELDSARIAAGDFNDINSASFDTLLGLAGATTDYLSQIAATGDYDTAIAVAGRLRDSYLDQLEAVGITGDAAQEYIEILGLAPDQVNTAITLAGLDEATFRINTYLELLGPGNIPPEVATEVLALVDEGNIQGAADRLTKFREDEGAKFLTLQATADTGPAADEIARLRLEAARPLALEVVANVKPQVDAVVSGALRAFGIGGRADGGPQAAREIGWIGERGPELWWPDTAGTVLNMEQVAAAVAGAGDQSTPSRTVQITNRFDGIVDPVQMASAQAQAMRDAEWLEAQGAFG